MDGWINEAKIFADGKLLDGKDCCRFESLPTIHFTLSWFISVIATVYSVQKMIPYLMLPHLFISLFLLFVAILLIILIAYHIITG
ncbi:unnamed protein product [Brugia pahangi]|uniref:Transmembrane protein n=1 Tax=Brugia pahangi TaxID=6280 RepID=A0A0N4T7J3_BRUPA|nr:unnamed protein product [Brugia pahangi]